jgi:hypothetical protein
MAIKFGEIFAVSEKMAQVLEALIPKIDRNTQCLNRLIAADPLHQRANSLYSLRQEMIVKAKIFQNFTFTYEVPQPAQIIPISDNKQIQI